MNLPASVILLMYITMSSFDCVSSQTKQDYKAIYTEIFTTNAYDKRVRPADVTTDAVDIDISFYLNGINEINEKEEKMVTTGYLMISWTDSGLQWDMASHNHIMRIYIPQNDIWKPDLVLQNGFTEFKEMGDTFYYVQVMSSGWVFWMPYQVFESRCSIDTTYYPFDKQTCHIIFVVWSHDSTEVNIQKSNWGINYDENFQNNSVWDIVKITYDVSLQSRESKMTFTFDLKRKPTYYVINIILPIIILGVLNCFVFVLPVEAGEKIGYSVTLLLALTVFLTIISSLLPTNSENTSVISVYIVIQVAFGGLAVVLSTIQLRLSQRKDDTPISGLYALCLRITKCKCPSKCKAKLSHQSDNIVHVKEKDGAFEGETDGCQEEKDEKYTWADVASSLDFIFFWCFVLAFFISSAVIFGKLLAQF